MRLTSFSTTLGKNPGASSNQATQKSEKERIVDKPTEKVDWGTHASVSLEPTDSEHPFISQSNLKLLTNFNNVYDEECSDLGNMLINIDNIFK